MDIRVELKELMLAQNMSTGYVSKAVDVSKSAVSMFINGTYKGNLSKLTDKLVNFIQREKERLNNEEIPFVEISIVKYIYEIARKCHTKGKIGVCSGVAGLGKTVAIKKYANEYMDSILIESDSCYTTKSLLKEIHKRLGLSGKGSIYDLMSDVILKLNQSGRLLIIDEAENLPYRALEITRRIHDKAGVGILLVGRNILVENLRGFNDEYDQLYSRVKYYKPLKNEILFQDVIKILDAMNLNTDLAGAYLKYSKGNTRRLEHLITHSISIAELNGKTEVDNAVIKKTSDLLMAPRRY